MRGSARLERAVVIVFACLFGALSFAAAETPAAPLLRIAPGHPWQPPFGLDRIGAPIRVLVGPADARTESAEPSLIAYREGQELSRERLALTGQSPIARAIDASADRIALLAGRAELAVLTPEETAFEAEVCPRSLVNPIDLGAILPPADWLLLAPGRAARLHVAAFCRVRDAAPARVVAWFDALPEQRVETHLELRHGRRSDIEIELPEPAFRSAHDTLQVSVQHQDGTELWHKQIDVMLITQPPTWPTFGARETTLRYDLPISLRNPETGALSTMPYSEGWPDTLKDVVVSLPNGSRFVFWRGSSYVPFWAGRGNTGLSYEWAETGPLPEGFVDSVEPLMDKELRYGRVSILESTDARVHVRWTYQSCDFNYKVWGDAAQEDFYFYPDGFGTRVLTLLSATDADYELSEFIVLAPPEGYPFDRLPQNPVRCVALDGTTMSVPIPFIAERIPPGPNPPILYRVQFGKDQEETAIYFNPRDPFRVEQLVTFRPFYDQGCMVTPGYWGSHWPLARGKTTGGAIDDRILVSPSHNSLISWARNRPDPVEDRTGPATDTLGQSRTMRTQSWVWLIGVTAAADGQLIARARSFSEPASLEPHGADLDANPYDSERRAYRLRVTANRIDIAIRPTVPCINPVFELSNATRTLSRVALDNRRLRDKEYAWDGRTLWLDLEIDAPAQLTITFAK